MPTTDSRLVRLRENDDLFTGIDFVHIVDRCDQTTLRVFFLTDIRNLTPSFEFDGAVNDFRLKPENVFIENATDPNTPNVRVETIVDVDAGGGAVTQAQFNDDLKRSYIELKVNEPGDFTQYRIRIVDDALEGQSPARFPRIDPYFNNLLFSFKVACETERDCLTPAQECPPEPQVDFAVDYLARDFVSFRNALLDFAAQRYPQWAFPLEADVGMMLAELFAALGDEFAYIQDRHAREAYLETASQRRSLRKKARLLDFEIHDGRSADTLLELTIEDPEMVYPQDFNFTVTAGQRVWAPSEGRPAVPFEIGRGIHDRVGQDPLTTTPREYMVRPGWNAEALTLYCFDASDSCLPIGATELFIKGELADAELLLEEPHLVLLRSEPTDPGRPRRRHYARVVDIREEIDPLMPDDGSGQTITRIVWADEDALPFELDQTELKLSFNIVPATQGATLEFEFVTGKTDTTPFGFPEAAQRQGPQSPMQTERPPIYLLGLPDTDTDGLGFLGTSLRTTTPEVRLELLEDNGAGGFDVDEVWVHRRTLIGAAGDEAVFTLEDGLWQRIRTFRRPGETYEHQDYAGNAGFSLRFGDGEFGRVPSPGSRFRVTYRTGVGTRGNLPPGVISLKRLSENGVEVSGGTEVDLPLYVAGVFNPKEVTTAADPESSEEIRLLAPEAYQANVFFAVRPEDFGKQAERLDFIQKAEASQRYTGSWLSTFVAGDAFGSNTMTDVQLQELEGWVDCVRQAGRDVVVRQPNTLSLDLEVRICVEAFAHSGQVLTLVEEVLTGSGVGFRTRGFFHPDNFTFGTPLRRSALEAAIQRVPGVKSVREMFYRIRGIQRRKRFSEMTLEVGDDQILRMDNNPLRPGNGSLTLLAEGGA